MERLEPANIICQKCGNGNYMRYLVGKGVGKFDMKCINCNTYFNFAELYQQKIAKTIKPQTKADHIRSMTDEELAEWLAKNDPECDPPEWWLDWLKQKVEDGK